MNHQGSSCDFQLTCGYLDQPHLLVNVHSDKGKKLNLVQKIKVLSQNQVDWSAVEIPHYVCEHCIKKLQNIFGDEDDEVDESDTDDSEIDSVDYDNYDYDNDEILQEIANDHQNAIMNIHIISVPRGSMSRG